MGRFKHLFLAMVAVAGLVLGGCGSDNNTIVVVPYNGKYLYVNNDGAANAVSGFAIKANGALVELAGSPFVTGGAGTSSTYFAANKIAVAHSKKLLFVSNVGDNTVTVFQISSVTGALTAVGTPVASGAVMGLSGSLAVDDGENFLFVANDDANGTADTSISVFAIAADGTLTAVPGSPFALGLPAAGLGADGITMNSVGDKLYVAASVDNSLAVLDVAVDGTLTQIPGSPFTVYTGTGGITSFVLTSPTFALSGSYGGFLGSYNIDSNGAPILLDSLDLGINNQALTTTRRGSLAILSGGFSSQISVVHVASDGNMTLANGSPFAAAASTSGYALANPSGRYLYATEINQIEAFVIDSEGSLTSISTYPLTNPGFTTSLAIY